MRRKKVMVAAMDWGLGHATRCIPVIRELLDLDCEVILAGAGPSLKLLQLEFPDLRSVRLPAYNPAYSRASVPLAMLRQLPKFFKIIREEHKETEKLVKDLNLVISDNRYGCWSAEVTSVIISHQLHILLPDSIGWLGGWVNKINQRLLSRFHECWVPDFPGSHFTGRLSEHPKLDPQYIGTLSRFDNGAGIDESYVFDVGVVLSGPEPQRTLLEDILLPQLSSSGLRCWMVRGVVDDNALHTVGSVEVAGHLETRQLESRLCKTRTIIARSGYSTIMDLARLQKKAVFIPTPGQTEQEYLAKRLAPTKTAPWFPQDQFSLSKALDSTHDFSGLNEPTPGQNLLRQRLQTILQTDSVLT